MVLLPITAEQNAPQTSQRHAIAIVIGHIFAFVLILKTLIMVTGEYVVHSPRETTILVEKFSALPDKQLFDTLELPLIVFSASTTDFNETTNALSVDISDNRHQKVSDNEVESFDDISYSWMLKEHPRFRVSPHELRVPKESLPKWAHKRSRKGQGSIPHGKHICFAHVGKCAGSTIGCSLGFSLHCRDSKKREGLLPLYTTNVIHNGVNDCPNHMPYYLFPLRNPIERVKSAYVYDRPMSPEDVYRRNDRQDELYNECPFWTLEELATNGLADDGMASKVCKKRASRAIQGFEKHGYHLWYNIRWFVQQTQVFSSSSTSQILVIRTEHLVDDWNSAEGLLQSGDDVPSQNSTFLKSFDRNNASSRNTTDGDSNLSEKALQLLCFYLCEEIRLYKMLLLKAINLNKNDYVESMEELETVCPVQAKSGSCPAIKN